MKVIWVSYRKLSANCISKIHISNIPVNLTKIITKYYTYYYIKCKNKSIKLHSHNSDEIYDNM